MKLLELILTLSDLGLVVGATSLLWWRYHILCMLLSLEVMLLSIFLKLSFLVSFNPNESSVLFIFISLVVCESSLGLGLLVSLSRSHGGDMISYIWGLV
uniref:NADH dehydrogenase subunit 4L n=1 Tax=Heptathela kimurai TaxID=88333 RepID=UPI0031F46D78